MLIVRPWIKLGVRNGKRCFLLRPPLNCTSNQYAVIGVRLSAGGMTQMWFSLMRWVWARLCNLFQCWDSFRCGEHSLSLVLWNAGLWFCMESFILEGDGSYLCLLYIVPWPYSLDCCRLSLVNYGESLARVGQETALALFEVRQHSWSVWVGCAVLSTNPWSIPGGRAFVNHHKLGKGVSEVATWDERCCLRWKSCKSWGNVKGGQSAFYSAFSLFLGLKFCCVSFVNVAMGSEHSLPTWMVFVATGQGLMMVSIRVGDLKQTPSFPLFRKVKLLFLNVWLFNNSH